MLQDNGGRLMRWRPATVLYWTAIGLVATAFALALLGEEMASRHVRDVTLRWHEWLGLLALVVFIAAVIARWVGKLPFIHPMPEWLPWLRAATKAVLYILLIIQPLSGWLLASHEGKLASFFGWSLPPLASPDSRLADYGYFYHGLGGCLILLIAALGFRLNISAIVFDDVGRVRRRRNDSDS
jgi:cytochrome b561